MKGYKDVAKQIQTKAYNQFSNKIGLNKAIVYVVFFGWSFVLYINQPLMVKTEETPYINYPSTAEFMEGFDRGNRESVKQLYQSVIETWEFHSQKVGEAAIERTKELLNEILNKEK